MTVKQRSFAVAVSTSALAFAVSACSSSSTEAAPTTSTTVPVNALASLNAARDCDLDARIVETAVAAYNAQNDTPIALNTGATAANSYAGTQGARLIPTYLNAWPSNPGYYVISLATSTSGGTAGQVIVWPVDVRNPSAKPHWVVYDSETTSNGCNGIRV